MEESQTIVGPDGREITVHWRGVDPSIPVGTAEWKKEKRLADNRASAARSRALQRVKLDKADETTGHLAEENAQLKAEVARLAAILRQHNLAVPPSATTVAATAAASVPAATSTLRVKVSVRGTMKAPSREEVETANARGKSGRKVGSSISSASTQSASSRGLDKASLPSGAASLASYPSSLTSSSSASPPSALLFDDDDEDEEEGDGGLSVGANNHVAEQSRVAANSAAVYEDDDDETDGILGCFPKYPSDHLNPLLLQTAAAQPVASQTQPLQLQAEEQLQLQLPALDARPLLHSAFSLACMSPPSAPSPAPAGLSACNINMNFFPSLPSPGAFWGPQANSAQTSNGNSNNSNNVMMVPLLLPFFPGSGGSGLSLVKSNSVYGPGEELLHGLDKPPIFALSSSSAGNQATVTVSVTNSSSGGGAPLSGAKRQRPVDDHALPSANNEDNGEGETGGERGAKRSRASTAHTTATMTMQQQLLLVPSGIEDHEASAAAQAAIAVGEGANKTAMGTVADSSGQDDCGEEEEDDDVMGLSLGGDRQARRLATRHMPIHTLLFLSFALGLAVVMKPHVGEVEYEYEYEYDVGAGALGSSNGVARPRSRVAGLRGGGHSLGPRGRLLLEEESVATAQAVHQPLPFWSQDSLIVEPAGVGDAPSAFSPRSFWPAASLVFAAVALVLLLHRYFSAASGALKRLFACKW